MYPHHPFAKIVEGSEAPLRVLITGIIFRFHSDRVFFGFLNNRSGSLNPLSTKVTKWTNTLKQFAGNLPTNCLSVFSLFMGLVLKGLRVLSDGSPLSPQ